MPPDAVAGYSQLHAYAMRCQCRMPGHQESGAAGEGGTELLVHGRHQATDGRGHVAGHTRGGTWRATRTRIHGNLGLLVSGALSCSLVGGWVNGCSVL